MTEISLCVCNGTCLVRTDGREGSRDEVFSPPRSSSRDRGSGGGGND